MYVHYSVVECSCVVGSNAPVVLTLYVTCYTIHLVVVVHFLDESGCPKFDFFRSIATPERMSAVISASC